MPLFSDDFSGASLDPAWELAGATGVAAAHGVDGLEKFVSLTVPVGDFDLWNNKRNALRLLQPCDNIDFTITVKFLTETPVGRYTNQGLFVVGTDETNWLRFEILRGEGTGADVNTKLRSFAATTTNDVSSSKFDVKDLPAHDSFFRLTRTGNSWLCERSVDGTNWTTSGTFTWTTTVTKVGILVGHTTGLPEYIAQVDYFEVSSDPITNEDSGSGGNELSATTDSAGLASAAALALSATCSVTTDEAVTASTGTLAALGALDATTDDATVASAGVSDSASTLAATTDDATIMADGALAIAGSVAGTTDDATLTASNQSAAPAVTRRALVGALLADKTGGFKYDGFPGDPIFCCSYWLKSAGRVDFKSLLASTTGQEQIYSMQATSNRFSARAANQVGGGTNIEKPVTGGYHDVWHHFFVRFDANGIEVCVDGDPSQTYTGTGVRTELDDVSIGTLWLMQDDGPDASGMFDGEAFDFTILHGDVDALDAQAGALNFDPATGEWKDFDPAMSSLVVARYDGQNESDPGVSSVGLLHMVQTGADLITLQDADLPPGANPDPVVGGPVVGALVATTADATSTSEGVLDLTGALTSVTDDASGVSTSELPVDGSLAGQTNASLTATGSLLLTASSSMTTEGTVPAVQISGTEYHTDTIWGAGTTAVTTTQIAAAHALLTQNGDTLVFDRKIDFSGASVELVCNADVQWVAASPGCGLNRTDVENNPNSSLNFTGSGRPRVLGMELTVSPHGGLANFNNKGSGYGFRNLPNGFELRGCRINGDLAYQVVIGNITDGVVANCEFENAEGVGYGRDPNTAATAAIYMYSTLRLSVVENYFHDMPHECIKCGPGTGNVDPHIERNTFEGLNRDGLDTTFGFRGSSPTQRATFNDNLLINVAQLATDFKASGDMIQQDMPIGNKGNQHIDVMRNRMFNVGTVSTITLGKADANQLLSTSPASDYYWPTIIPFDIVFEDNDFQDIGQLCLHKGGLDIVFRNNRHRGTVGSSRLFETDNDLDVILNLPADVKAEYLAIPDVDKLLETGATTEAVLPIPSYPQYPAGPSFYSAGSAYGTGELAIASSVAASTEDSTSDASGTLAATGSLTETLDSALAASVAKLALTASSSLTTADANPSSATTGTEYHTNDIFGPETTTVTGSQIAAAHALLTQDGDTLVFDRVLNYSGGASLTTNNRVTWRGGGLHRTDVNTTHNGMTFTGSGHITLERMRFTAADHGGDIFFYQKGGLVQIQDMPNGAQVDYCFFSADLAFMIQAANSDYVRLHGTHFENSLGVSYLNIDGREVNNRATAAISAYRSWYLDIGFCFFEEIPHECIKTGVGYGTRGVVMPNLHDSFFIGVRRDDVDTTGGWTGLDDTQRALIVRNIFVGGSAVLDAKFPLKEFDAVPSGGFGYVPTRYCEVSDNQIFNKGRIVVLTSDGRKLEGAQLNTTPGTDGYWMDAFCQEIHIINNHIQDSVNVLNKSSFHNTFQNNQIAGTGGGWDETNPANVYNAFADDIADAYLAYQPKVTISGNVTVDPLPVPTAPSFEYGPEAATDSFTGELAIAATAALATDDATVDATGQAGITATGVLGATTDAATASSTATLEVQGALSATTDDVAVAASGARGLTAEAALVTGDATLSSSAAVYDGAGGFVAATTEGATATSTGELQLRSAISATTEDAGVSVFGALGILAQAGLALEPAILFATGADTSTGVRGNVSVVVAAAALDATGVSQRRYAIGTLLVGRARTTRI